MVELQNGQVMPLQAALSGTDSEGKPLEFKETSKGTWVAEDDKTTYTVQGEPQTATVTRIKKNSSIAKINDPYFQRIAANAPVAEGSKGKTSTESRETKEFGQPARRTDVR